MTTSITTLVLCGGTVKQRCTTSSKFFPVGQRHQFLEDFLQPLKSAFMIPGCAGHLLAILHIFAIRFADLRYLFPQLGDALFDRSLHSDRLAEHKAPIRIRTQRRALHEKP